MCPIERLLSPQHQGGSRHEALLDLVRPVPRGLPLARRECRRGPVPPSPWRLLERSGFCLRLGQSGSRRRFVPAPCPFSVPPLIRGSPCCVAGAVSWASG